MFCSILISQPTKTYKKREYKGKKKDGTKAQKKEHNKKRKETYASDIDSQVTKDGILSDYKVSLGMEYKYGESQPTILEVETMATLKSIIETTLYIYEVIDAYLGGKKMKQAEIEKPTAYQSSQRKRKSKKKEFAKGKLPVRFEISPPKFTGGITYKYQESTKYPGQVGVNYSFVLGALPLIRVDGRLDLLFAAQFIPYLGIVVKALDGAVAAVNKGGEILEFFGVGNMEADYYFDLVASAQLDIDIVKGATYHTLDGFTSGTLTIESPLKIGLEAGGSIKAKIFKLSGEAVIHAETTAKFNIYYRAEKKDFLTFEFEGVEAIVTAKFDFEGDKDKKPKPQAKPPKPVQIFDSFSVDIPLFSASYKPNNS